MGESVGQDTEAIDEAVQQTVVIEVEGVVAERRRAALESEREYVHCIRDAVEVAVGVGVAAAKRWIHDDGARFGEWDHRPAVRRAEHRAHGRSAETVAVLCPNEIKNYGYQVSTMQIREYCSILFHKSLLFNQSLFVLNPPPLI